MSRHVSTLAFFIVACTLCLLVAGCESGSRPVVPGDDKPETTLTDNPGDESEPPPTYINTLLEIGTMGINGAMCGQPYEETIRATGGSGEGYVWTVKGLPEGLEAKEEGRIVKITGTIDHDRCASAVDEYDVTVKVCEKTNKAQQALKAILGKTYGAIQCAKKVFELKVEDTSEAEPVDDDNNDNNDATIDVLKKIMTWRELVSAGRGTWSKLVTAGMSESTVDPCEVPLEIEVTEATAEVMGRDGEITTKDVSDELNEGKAVDVKVGSDLDITYKVKNGEPPYTWRVSEHFTATVISTRNGIIQEYADFPTEDFFTTPDGVPFERIGNDSIKVSRHFSYKEDIFLDRDAEGNPIDKDKEDIWIDDVYKAMAFREDPVEEHSIYVTDTCGVVMGGRNYGGIRGGETKKYTFNVKYPVDIVDDVMVQMDLWDVNDTSSATTMTLYLQDGDEEEAHFYYELDPCGDDGSHNGDECEGPRGPTEASDEFVTGIDNVRIGFTDEACFLCGVLDIDINWIKFFTDHWVAFYDDGANGNQFDDDVLGDAWVNPTVWTLNMMNDGTGEIFYRRIDVD